MERSDSSRQPPLRTGTGARELAEALRAAGFDPVSLTGHLAAYHNRDGEVISFLAGAVHEGRAPLDHLYRLFLRGRAVDRARLSVVLPPPLLARLADDGLLEEGPDGVRSLMRIDPVDSWYLLSDFPSPVTGRDGAPDFVLGNGPAALNLARLTPREPVDSVLDLGCGGGIQSLWASRHARRVVGTDTNQRALDFAAFTMALNGVENVDLRRGSLFAPVAGERFDLVVCNPPFVISPETRSEYRSATDAPGDELVETVVRGAEAHMAPGGMAVILLNWHHRDDDDWAERPLSWTQGSGCGSWLLCFATERPLPYALKWLRDGRPLDDGELEDRLGDWGACYEALGAGRISSGAMVLHNPPGGASWQRAERLARDVAAQGECGDHLRRICLAESLLAERSDEELLGAVLRPAPDHRMAQEAELSEGRWSVRSETLGLTRGLGLAVRSDVTVVALLQALDGRSTVSQAVARAAAALGVDPAGAVEPALITVKILLRQGLVVPCS